MRAIRLDIWATVLGAVAFVLLLIGLVIFAFGSDSTAAILWLFVVPLIFISKLFKDWAVTKRMFESLEYDIVTEWNK